MRDLNILILYKDKSYKIIPAKKISLLELSKKNIKLIFIPLYDNPNAYIPIKPSELYHFSKASVSIIYQAFIYDLDDQLGTSFTPQEFNADCDNIVDFINAIYNVYKFRAISIYLSENNNNMTTGRTLSFIMSIRQINVKFYNEKNQLIHEIDSGVMKDLSEYSAKYFWKTPPPYTNEDRINCLHDILYTPCTFDDNYFTDLDNLPICIQIQDNQWKTIKKPSKELTSEDYVLYKIPNFEIYYMMQFGIYNQLLSFNEFELHYVASPIFEGYDTDYLTSLDKGKIPSFMEKEAAIDAYLTGDLFNICNCIADINSPDIFLQSMIYANSIISYIKYFGVYCYGEEHSDMKMRTFILFGRGLGIYGFNEMQGSLLLTDLEMSYDKVIEAFLMMIMKGR